MSGDGHRGGIGGNDEATELTALAPLELTTECLSDAWEDVVVRHKAVDPEVIAAVRDRVAAVADEIEAWPWHPDQRRDNSLLRLSPHLIHLLNELVLTGDLAAANHAYEALALTHRAGLL